MTRTKTNKLIAILMAVFMAFAFMSFSLTYVSAEDGEEGDPGTSSSSSSSSSSTSSTTSTTVAEKSAPTPEISITTYTYGAPDLKVKIDFKAENATPQLDYANWTQTDNLKIIMDSIKVFSDKDLTKEVTISNKQLSDFTFKDNVVEFTVPLSKANGLSAATTYYLYLGDALNETTEVKGESTFFEFKTNTTTTSRKTTRTTYRTVTTRATTVRAKSANTGDPSNLPVWIGLAVVAAILGGVVVVNKEKE